MAFSLTDKQREAGRLLASDAREILLYGGSRAAKTFLIVYTIIVRACKCRSRHIIVRQKENTCITTVFHETWNKVIEIAFPQLRDSLKIHRRPHWVEFPNGSEVWFAGLDDDERAEKILGRECSTVFFNEASQIQYSSFTKAFTRGAEQNALKKKYYIDENPPSKSHWTYDRFIRFVDPISGEPLDKTKVKLASMLMNPIDNVSNLDDEYIQILESLPESERNRFLHGRFSDTVEGGIYTKELFKAEVDNRITDVQPVEGYPINAVFDIGISDDTAIWFVQFLKDKILLLDYYSNNRMSLPEYLNIIYNDKKYNIATMYLPHDAKNKSWSTGRSIREVAVEHGDNKGFRVVVLPQLGLWDGINGVRVLFDKCYFNNVKCTHGIECLRNYRVDFNEKSGTDKDKPVHDWSSHGADAFRYVCMAYNELQVKVPKKEVPKPEGWHWTMADEMNARRRDRLNYDRRR